MSEEEGKNNDDVTMSAEELSKIEKEVLSKDANEREVLAAKMKEEIRAEIAKEQELERLKSEKERLEQALLQQTKNKDLELETLKKELDETKEKIGSSKRVITPNIQPPDFSKGANSEAESFIKNLTPEDVNRINDNSGEKFWEHTARRK